MKELSKIRAAEPSIQSDGKVPEKELNRLKKVFLKVWRARPLSERRLMQRDLPLEVRLVHSLADASKNYHTPPDSQFGKDVFACVHRVRKVHGDWYKRQMWFSRRIREMPAKMLEILISHELVHISRANTGWDCDENGEQHDPFSEESETRQMNYELFGYDEEILQNWIQRMYPDEVKKADAALRSRARKYRALHWPKRSS